MKSSLILEMLDNGEIEQLKKMLEEDIYKSSLSRSGGEKNRFAAMKRYFRFIPKETKEIFTKPVKNAMINGSQYNVFCDTFSMVLTHEEVDAIDHFYSSSVNYESTINSYKAVIDEEEINLNEALAEAKVKGYKFKKAELSSTTFGYLLQYHDAYFNISLLDKAFGIINDGQKAKVSYSGKFGMMRIETSIGIAYICAMQVAAIDLSSKTIIKI